MDEWLLTFWGKPGTVHVELARAGVDEHDLQRRKGVADTREFGFDVIGGDDIAVLEVAEVQLHRGL